MGCTATTACSSSTPTRCPRRRSSPTRSQTAAPSSAAASIPATVRSARSSRSPGRSRCCRSRITACLPSTGWSTCSWKVQGSAYATPPDAPIAGAGSYTVGGEVAVQQRMEAELQVADEPSAPFDSGLVVGGGGFPDADRRRDLEERQGLLRHGDARSGQGGAAPGTSALSQLLAGLVALLGIAARRTHRLR